MAVKYTIEDFGDFRRLYAKGPHTHERRGNAKICYECYLDLPFSVEFLEQLVDYWYPDGIFSTLEQGICKASFSENPKKAIDRFCSDINGYTILDFGSGMGYLSAFCLEKGAKQVILAEIDEKILELSKSYLKEIGNIDNCKFFAIKEEDPLSMIEDKSLDLIIASEVFEHIFPWQRKTILETLYSKLKPGGIIIITAPNSLFPKDGHTTGLWFAAWLPTPLGVWYAKTFAAWRWKNATTEFLLRGGLRQYSYFEAKKVLEPLGAENLCLKYPQKQIIPQTNSLKGRIFYNLIKVMYNIFLKYFGPWEAWQSALQLGWAKPIE